MGTKDESIAKIAAKLYDERNYRMSHPQTYEEYMGIKPYKSAEEHLKEKKQQTPAEWFEEMIYDNLY